MSWVPELLPREAEDTVLRRDEDALYSLQALRRHRSLTHSLALVRRPLAGLIGSGSCGDERAGGTSVSDGGESYRGRPIRVALSDDLLGIVSGKVRFSGTHVWWNRAQGGAFGAVDACAGLSSQNAAARHWCCAKRARRVRTLKLRVRDRSTSATCLLALGKDKNRTRVALHLREGPWKGKGRSSTGVQDGCA